MARKRVFVTGSERAEFEYIYGPKPVDQEDNRFLLLTEEEEALLEDLPAGVPVRQSQDLRERERIAAHAAKARGDDENAVEVEPVDRGKSAESAGRDAAGEAAAESAAEEKSSSKSSSKK